MAQVAFVVQLSFALRQANVARSKGRLKRPAFQTTCLSWKVPNYDVDSLLGGQWPHCGRPRFFHGFITGQCPLCYYCGDCSSLGALRSLTCTASCLENFDRLKAGPKHECPGSAVASCLQRSDFQSHANSICEVAYSASHRCYFGPSSTCRCSGCPLRTTAKKQTKSG